MKTLRYKTVVRGVTIKKHYTKKAAESFRKSLKNRSARVYPLSSRRRRY